MADCLEQTPGTSSALLVNFHVFLELKHAGFFSFVFLNKTYSIPEWLHCGVTRNGSGIRTLDLLWRCFLVRITGTGLIHHFQDPRQV